MGLLSEVSPSCVKPCTNEEDTIGVEGKLLVNIVASQDLSTSSLIMCGGSLAPSRWMHSNSHMVESLKWWWWLSSHGKVGISSYVGLVVVTLILSMEMHSLSFVVVAHNSLMFSLSLEWGGCVSLSHGVWCISSCMGVGGTSVHSFPDSTPCASMVVGETTCS